MTIIFCLKANAEETIYELDIPSQDLTSALNQLAVQTGAVVLFPSEITESRKSAAVKGSMALDEAISLLLQNTGLSGDLSNKRVIGIFLDEIAESNEIIEGEDMSNNNSRNTSLLMGMAVALGLMGSSDVLAQNPSGAEEPSTAASSSRTLETIVVSSRRREESLQDVPISIVAVGAAAIEDRGILNVQDVGEHVANVTLTTSDRPQNSRVVIRGIGGGFGDPTRSFGAGLYIDGAYLANSLGSYTSTMEVERVEVLRGPQGTLFGRNTTGGAVNVIPKRPGPDFEGNVMARVGSYGQQDFRAIVNAPITDNFYARIGVTSENTDGYYTELNTGDKYSGHNLQATTIALRWEPNNTNWTIDLATSQSRENESARGGDCDYIQDTRNNTERHLSSGLSGSFEEACNRSADAGQYKFYSDKQGMVDNKLESYSGRAVWDSEGAFGIFDNLTLTTLASYRRNWFDLVHDRDYTDERFDAVESAPGGQRIIEGTNAEILLEALVFDDRLDLLLGYNYFRDEQYAPGEACNQLALDRLPGEEVICDQSGGNTFDLVPNNITGMGPSPFYTDNSVDNESSGVFAHASWRATDWLTLDAGIRYIDDTRRFKALEIDITNTAVGPQFIVNDDTVATLSEGEQDFSETVSMFTASVDIPVGGFDALDSMMVYGTYSEGYLSGGFNTELPVDLIPADLIDELYIYGPENVINNEIGIKSSWAGGSITASFAYFNMDYKDKQVEVPLDAEGFGAPGLTDREFFTNAGQATIEGIELEVNAAITDRLGIDFSLGKLDQQYDEFLSFNPDTGLFDNRTDANFDTFSPDVTFAGNIKYDIPFANGVLTPSLGLFYRSGYEFEGGLDQSDPKTDCYQDAYTKANARLTYRSNDGLRLSAFANNITGESYYDFCDINAGSRGARRFQYAAQEWLGLEVSYDF